METAKNITEFSKGKETKQLEGIDVQKFNKHLTSQTIEDVDKQETPSITWKDIKALKRSKYFKIKDKYDKAFVLSHNKTGAIVEIQAASSFHACNIIGWRPRHTKVIEVINVKDKKKQKHEKINATNVETSGSSSDG